MHMQAPTLTTTHRQPLFVVVAALALAAIVAAVIVLATRDNSSSTAILPVHPNVVQSAPDRVLDGSPLLRTHAATRTRNLDGSPLLRNGGSAVPHSGGGPRVRPHAVTSSRAATTSSPLQFAVRPPEGFHRAP
jgi:hypothetical protein